MLVPWQDPVCRAPREVLRPFSTRILDGHLLKLGLPNRRDTHEKHKKKTMHECQARYEKKSELFAIL